MTEELDSRMDQIENLEPTEANEWLRSTKSSYPSEDPGPRSAEADPEECGGDPTTPSDQPDPADAEPGGDSYTRSD